MAMVVLMLTRDTQGQTGFFKKKFSSPRFYIGSNLNSKCFKQEYIWFAKFCGPFVNCQYTLQSYQHIPIPQIANIFYIEWKNMLTQCINLCHKLICKKFRFVIWESQFRVGILASSLKKTQKRFLGSRYAFFSE